MKRRLVWSNAFVRSCKRHLRRDTVLEAAMEKTLRLLETDAFHPSLETHKLKGKLAGVWACSAGYDLRLVFEFAPGELDNEEDILLLDIGTHDEVY